jgi:hypothetical protein
MSLFGEMLPIHPNRQVSWASVPDLLNQPFYWSIEGVLPENPHKQSGYQECDRTSFFKELRIFLQQTGYIRNPGQTEFYRLAQLEKTGIYNKCPQGTRLTKAGETANYRFGLCSAQLAGGSRLTRRGA